MNLENFEVEIEEIEKQVGVRFHQELGIYNHLFLVGIAYRFFSEGKTFIIVKSTTKTKV